MTEKKTPEIRFKGFQGEWEKSKLGEVADIVGGGTPSTNIEEYWNGEVDWYSPAELGKQIYLSNSKKKITKLGLQKSSAKILPIGSVLFTSRAGIGNTAILAKEGTTNQGFQSIIPHKDKLDSYFIYSKTYELKRYGEINGAGSTFVEISGKQMVQMPIKIPEIKEQRAISCFFRRMDHLITLQQRKCDKLQSLKKAMLEKMFPKDGADVPEVRLRGFTGAWEKRKLGNCFDERQERSAEGELISVTINDGIKRFEELGRHDNSSEDKSHYKRVEVGDIAYNSMRMWQGASGYSLYSGILSPAYTVLIPKEDVDSVFFSYAFKRSQMIHIFQICSQGITSDTWNLKFPAFSEIETILPGLEEQKKIGQYFRNLDQFIDLQQHKLEKLKNIKQALLQKMFV